MNPRIIAMRAIASEFAYRVYWPIVIILIVVGIGIVSLMIWLVTMSAWWWLLAVPVYLSMSVGVVAALFAYGILKALTPIQNKTQKRLVKGFVDKIQKLSEITQTPKIFLLFRAIRDMANTNRTGLIQSVIDDTGSLNNDFKEIVEAFTVSAHK